MQDVRWQGEASPTFDCSPHEENGCFEAIPQFIFRNIQRGGWKLLVNFQKSVFAEWPCFGIRARHLHVSRRFWNGTQAISAASSGLTTVANVVFAMGPVPVGLAVPWS